MMTRDEILENFKKEISLIRGKIYTFNCDCVDSTGVKEWFYFTTVPPENRTTPFEGAITEGLSVSTELVPDPTLTKIPASAVFTTEEDVFLTQWQNWMPRPFKGWHVERSITYEDDGYFFVDSSQQHSESLELKNKVPGGYYYQVTYQTVDQTGGYIYPNLGFSSGNATYDDGVYTTILDTTAYPGLDMTFLLTYDQNFLGKIVYVSLKRVGVCSESFTFTPSFEHPDTIYYASATTENMGSKIHILNERGAIVNSEERYYTLGINQTNRTYAPIMKSDPHIVKKFLIDGLPGGLFKNVYNLPPTGTTASDRGSNIYYDAVRGDKTVSLSGLISDPEDDTLNYRWSHFAPKKTMDGVSLLTTFEDPTSLETTAELVVPPTDMIYTLHLEVADSDNVTTIPINVKVSGVVDFEDWSIGISGINTFDLGDSNVPFDDLD